MGWFDEDDSDDDDASPQPPVDEQVTLKTGGNNEEEEEDEDPLDAFMSNLRADADTNALSLSQPCVAAAGRLDLANDDEGEGDDNVGEDDDSEIQNIGNDRHTEPEDSAVTMQSARQALESTFHKEGEHRKRRADNYAALIGVATAADGATNKKDDAATLPILSFQKQFWAPTDTPEGRQWQSDRNIHCSTFIDPIYDFAELRDVFGEALLERLNALNYQQPTLVQSQTLPVALAGRDALVTAQTGQGKTMAYLWPLLMHVADQPALAGAETGPIGLILVPTRELAQQVQQQVQSILEAALPGGVSKSIIGGQGKYQLQLELRRQQQTGIDICVATPGRMLDVLADKKKDLSLTRCTFVVLDEADKMLSMGFESQVRQILAQTTRQRQTMLLSATLGRKVEEIAKEWLHKAVRISIGRTGQASEHVTQHVMALPTPQAKTTFLLEMLPTLQALGRTLVFVATRDSCESLATAIRQALPDLAVATLHGDKHQSDRTSALKAFAKGKILVLIATDVASRGLDVPEVSTVLNFDAPKNLDIHTHRIGRAGRLSKDNEQQSGSAYTLLTPKNADFAHVLVNAFEREGREVSSELRQLAETSRRSGSAGGVDRSKVSKAGLGFHSSDTSYNDPLNSASAALSAPLAKRSRWN